MALSFPLSLASFLDLFTRIEATMDIGEAVLSAKTGGGEIITSNFGERLWAGRFTGQGHAFISLDEMTARIGLLRKGGASFLIRNPYRRGPAADPEGTILGAATPQITTFNANNRDITISGLPAGYVLRRGDLIGWTYLTGPTRYALHRVVTGVTANGSGVATTEVMPPVRSGYATPQSVTLVNPVCKAVMVPGSYQPPSVQRNGIATFSFAWWQTLK